MKRMAVLTLTSEALREILQLPDNTIMVEARIPFLTPGVMEIKVEGAGWLTPECAAIMVAEPAIVTRLENGALDIDWRIPTET